jgi:CheY-like chemotaxis protein
MSSSLLNPDNRVLIVDDNPHYARILRMMLERSLGFTNITTAESTAEGKRLLDSGDEEFQIVFVDFHFPDGSTGGKLLEELKAEGKLGAIAAFLITAEPTMESLKQALSAGARGVVAKPFDSAELRKQLEKAERARIVDEDSDLQL